MATHSSSTAAATSPHDDPWRNRIVGQADVSPDGLVANPRPSSATSITANFLRHQLGLKGVPVT